MSIRRSTMIALLAAALGLPLAAGAACPGECSVPGKGSKFTECFVEHDGVTLNFPADKPKQVRCTDGDAACDVDAIANGVCTFSLRACLNNTDPRFVDCVPTDVASYEVRNKDPLNPKFDPQLQALEDAVAALGLPTAAAVCTDPQTIAVPLRVKNGNFRRTKKRVKTKAATAGGVRDNDTLKLFCEPSTLFPGPASGYARAFEISTEAQRIGGQLGRSDIGDFLLVNDKIQAAILRPGRFAWNAVGIYGGNLIDADRHHADGVERDSFEVLATGINLENTANYTAVSVLNDGTDGNPAIVRATGPDDLLDFINPSSTVAGFGFAFPSSADDRDLDVDVTTDYILAPGASYVQIETTITNNDPAQLDIFMAEYLNGSGQLELFQPVYGFGEPLLTTSCGVGSYLACTAGSCDRCNYVAYSGEDDAREVSYGFIHEVNGTTTFNTSGVTVPLLGREAITTLVGIDGPNFMIPGGGGTLTLTRYLAVGDGSAASIAAIRNEIVGFTTGTLEGKVTSGGQGVADADVAVRAASFGGYGAPPSENVVLHFRTASDGTYSGTLPPGDYTVDANVDGRLAASPPAAPVTISAGATKTQNFSIGPAGHLQVTVTDENSQPIPAKVQVIGFDPTPDPLNTQSILGVINNTTGVFGARTGANDGLPFGVVAVAFADATGDTGVFDVEPGTYQVAVSRGPRYSAFTQNVTISSGLTEVVPAQLAEVVPTPGYISGDWHVHSINSADCEVTNAERVATELSEGMDFFTPSDHEVRVDFAPTIADMGVGSLIATAPSEEITTFDYGHFNSWPVTVDPLALSGGGIDHGRAGVTPGEDFPSFGNYSLSPAEIFTAVHADPNMPLVQINHMDSHFDTNGLDIDTAEGGTGPPQSHMDPADRRLDPGIGNFFDDGFDALEVWIGTNNRGGYEDDFLGVNAGDWVNLINQGIVRAGVTSSDTHQRVATQINARSYVASAVTDPALLAGVAGTLATNVMDGRLTGTNGPFVTITSSAASTGQTGGLDITLPTEIATTNGAVDITVTVRSPIWAPFDQIQFLVNNAPQPWDHDADTGTRPRYRVIPDFVHTAGANFTVTEVDDFPAISGARHLEATTTLNLTGLTVDTWVLAIVRGTDGVSEPLFPFYPNSIDQGSNTNLAQLTDGNLGEGGMLAFAYTNPLFVDVDGGGWTHQGVVLTPP